MAAKMKSVSASGMRSGLPRPMPVPVTPPAEKANCASTIWKPSSFAVRPRVEPDVDAVLHVLELAVGEHRAAREQQQRR